VATSKALAKAYLPFKITEDVRKYATEQGISETGAPASGLKEKSAEWSELGSRDIDGQAERPGERERMSQFVEKGAELYAITNFSGA
jgi:hypothetical protein